MQSVAIIGAGGFAREVLDVIDAVNDERPQFEVLGFIVDPEYASAGAVINGKPILGGFDWLAKRSEDTLVICGVGSSQHRYHLVKRAQAAGCQFFSVVHPSAVLTKWVQLGQGVVITAGCVLTNQIRIGNHVHMNLDCTIGHDSEIEDFVTFAPGVHVSGKVTVGEGAYVGTGAVIVEKMHIGEWSLVGAGSAVIGDVPPNTTVVGVPGKVVRTREPGWHLHGELP